MVPELATRIQLTFTLTSTLVSATLRFHSSAKRGRDYLLQVQQQQHSSKLDSIEILPLLHKSMIQPLFPPSLHTVFDKNDTTRTLSGDAILWRERSVLVSLRILCAAAGREETLGWAVKSSPISLNIVPVILLKPLCVDLFSTGDWKFKVSRYRDYRSYSLQRQEHLLSVNIERTSSLLSLNILPIMAHHYTAARKLQKW